MTTFIIKNASGTAYGAIVYGESGTCLWSSAMVESKEEAVKKLDEWLKSYNWEGGAKA